MTQGLLFDRRWRLQVGDWLTDSLRVVFEVQRNRDYHPNNSTITVYNTTQETRTAFARGQRVSLFGGYASGVDLLFSGGVYTVQTKRDGPDWVTTMQVRDGNAAWTRYVNQSFAAGVPVVQVLDAVAASMGLVVPQSTRQALQGRLTRGQLVNSGYAYRAMQELLTSEGLTWSIQDNALQVLAQGAATSEEAILLTPQTGLIGSPEVLEQTVIRNGQRRKQVTCTSLLQGGLRPGRQVVLRDAAVSGTFAVESVVHRGDSRGQDWYSEATLIALG